MAPLAEPVEILQILLGEGWKGALGLTQGLELGLVDLAFLELVGIGPEDLVVVEVEVDIETTRAGVSVDVDRLGERDRRREESLLQQQGRHVPGRPAPASGGDCPVPSLSEGEQPFVRRRLAGCRRVGKLADLSVDEALRLLEIALQPTDRDLLKRCGIDLVAAHESLRVDHLQQRSERLCVAVVRRSAQEKPMLRAFGDVANRTGPLRIDGVAASLLSDLVGADRAARGDVVSLVDDEDVEREALAWCW